MSLFVPKHNSLTLSECYNIARKLGESNHIPCKKYGDNKLIIEAFEATSVLYDILKNLDDNELLLGEATIISSLLALNEFNKIKGPLSSDEFSLATEFISSKAVNNPKSPLRSSFSLNTEKYGLMFIDITSITYKYDPKYNTNCIGELTLKIAGSSIYSKEMSERITGTAFKLALMAGLFISAPMMFPIVSDIPVEYLQYAGTGGAIGYIVKGLKGAKSDFLHKRKDRTDVIKLVCNKISDMNDYFQFEPVYTFINNARTFNPFNSTISVKIYAYRKN